MRRKNNGHRDNLRRRIAVEAARIIADEGLSDYLLAKRKAAQRLGMIDLAGLPKNSEIEEALGERLRLFESDSHGSRLRSLRSTAREIMQVLEEFQPRLVGPVLSGTVTDHADISLHLFADTPEVVALALIERAVPYELKERRLRYLADRIESYPCYRFFAGAIGVEGIVFPLLGMRQAPCCPIDGRPMRRAALTEVESLLD